MRSTRRGTSSVGGVPQSNRVTRAIHAFRPRRKSSRTNTHNDQDTSTASNPPPSRPPLGRRVTNIVTAFSQVNPHGLGVIRPSDPLTTITFSPFLLLEHCTPQPLAITSNRSADAPRKGQQTLTFLTQGHLKYSDTHGHNADLYSGDVALLSANSGLVVSNQFEGPVVEYFSIWINTPRELRNNPPTFNQAHSFPAVQIGEGLASARIKVLTAPIKEGLSKEHPSSPELATLAGNAAVYDIHMRRQSQLVLNPETTRVFVYVYRGTAVIGKATEVREGQMAVLEEDESLPLVIKSIGANLDDDNKTEEDDIDFDTFEEHSCWCIVLAGDPIEEPVSMLPSGIVACTPQEMRKAFEDFTCGSMGTGSPPGVNSSPFASLDEDSDEESLDEMRKLFDGLAKKKSGECLPHELVERLKL